MDIKTNKRFQKVVLPVELTKVMVKILSGDDQAKKALFEIARFTQTPGNSEVNGIGLTELSENVSELNNSRANAQRVIAMLTGMTVIYYKKIGRKHKYQLNHRGVQLIKQL